MGRVLALCLALLASPLVVGRPALAQEVAPATLVADQITFDRERLTAEGSVEIFADGRVLRAQRLVYLREEDRLLVEGPLTLLDGPDTIIVADFASLRSNLRGSILEGARLVLDQQLQIAAAEIATGTEGRFVQLNRTVASSCEVCANSPVPLWQIRAERIIHDREERQLYFENARFEVVGIPVAWLPRFRVPDPTVTRTTGLLLPRPSNDDQLGTGVALPYFITLGPSRDLTLIPFVTTTETLQLGFRYRQAFNNGAIRFEGAVARDDIRPGETRGYLFSEGVFFLPRDYRLDFDVELVTDDTYLLDFNVTEKDRLDSRIALSKVDRNDRFLAEVTAIRTLRAGEDSSFLPTRILTVERQGVRALPILGGQALWTLQAHGRENPASFVPPGSGLPPDAAQDVLRASAGLDWRNSTVLPSGLVATALAGVQVDVFNVSQDPTFRGDTFARVVPHGGFELRMPLVRRGANGVRHVIEPTAQLIFSPNDVTDAPEEDSLTPEFDEGNLFSSQRFAGRDTRELSSRLNIGVSYDRIAPNGWQLGGVVGRVIREEDLQQFTTGTGLDGLTSDWLVASTVRWRDQFEFLNRSTFDDDFVFSRNETILRWNGKSHSLETRFTWLEADVLAARPIDTSEWIVNASVDVTPDWTLRANSRYDFVIDDATRAGVGVTYRTECVTVDFDVERRFTSNVVLEPSTRFGFGLELVGFGADDRGTRSRRCGI
ncbi:MAG: LPS assembly protein LptD [Pseudomonadota bacterium]